MAIGKVLHGLLTSFIVMWDLKEAILRIQQVFRPDFSVSYGRQVFGVKESIVAVFITSSVPHRIKNIKTHSSFVNGITSSHHAMSFRANLITKFGICRKLPKLTFSSKVKVLDSA